MSLNNQELHKELELKDFFQKAYKKERYLEICYRTRDRQDHQSFLKALNKKSRDNTFNYYEYEFLRSAFGFPLLIKKYGYSCFEKVYQQVEKQYQDMPEAFKGHLTFDEDGKQVSLRTPMKIKQMVDRFYES
ncbi:hypothetical protein ACE3NQ_21290 [Paenibacillus terreus]|uniref:Uncharacterized protein n=1 Tax=Paenibacillus terreus TaxID=1387834 RepID=A0ABV5BD20_9BACL